MICCGVCVDGGGDYRLLEEISKQNKTQCYSRFETEEKWSCISRPLGRNDEERLPGDVSNITLETKEKSQTLQTGDSSLTVRAAAAVENKPANI